jgi:hypothetical protein
LSQSRIEKPYCKVEIKVPGEIVGSPSGHGRPIREGTIPEWKKANHSEMMSTPVPIFLSS